MSEVARLTPPGRSLGHTVRIPGSKSYTNRALILAAIAKGESTLHYPSYSDDSKALIAALTKLGVSFQQKGDSLKVGGKAGQLDAYEGEIDVGPAGTTMRFLISLCSLIEGADIVLRGSERMHQRPVSDLVEALREIGASIEYLGKDGCPPLRIRGSGRINGGTVSVRGDLSSQYFSSLLMVGPLLRDGLIIKVEGKQISRSYLDMTFDSLKSFGVLAKNNSYRSYYVQGGQLPKAVEYQIEGDASGASYFWALAAIAGSAIKVVNINPESAQGDVMFPRLLEKMGCNVSSGFTGKEGWIRVAGPKKLQGIIADMTLMPDTAQTLAVVASRAAGKTSLSGLSTLRIKETDRIQALVNELSAIGIEASAGDDNITIHPSEIKPARIKTYDDHRMAMSFAILGAICPGMEIEEPAVVTKSFPEFWQLLSKLGVGVEVQ